MKKKRTAIKELNLKFLYNKKDDIIMIPAGMKRFSAIDYVDRYPIIWSKVAGTSAKIHEEAIQTLVAYKRMIREGNDECIIETTLIPEPNNQFDPFAIGIHTEFKDVNLGGARSRKIGYLPKELAKLLTQIERKYNIKYKAELDKIQSNMTKEKDIMGFPCSAAVTLTPDGVGVGSAPIHKVQYYSGQALMEMKERITRENEGG